jgi:putative hydrolase of the HAD superfamily
MPGRTVVLFDLYGTLVDVDVDESDMQVWTALAERLEGWSVSGREDPGDLQAAYLRLCAEEAQVHDQGNILPKVFTRLLSHNGEVPNGFDVRTFAHLFRKLSITRLTLRPYAVRVLDHLRGRGVRPCLVSNTESILTEYDIEQLHLSGAFDVIVLSSDLGLVKPDPGILDAALRQVGCARDDAVMVGDTWATDVKAGLATGIPVVFLDEDAGPTPVLDLDGSVIRVHPDGDSILEGLRRAGVPA